MMYNWYEYGFILLMAMAIAGGIVGALARSWSLHSRLYSLEERQAVLERTMISEVKKRASDAARSSKRDLEHLVDAVPTTKPEPWYSSFVHPDLKKTKTT